MVVSSICIPSTIINKPHIVATNMRFMDTYDSLKDTYESIKNSLENISKGIDTIKKLVHYVFHPTEVAPVLWTNLVKSSFYICLFMCLMGLIFYIVGFKKGRTMVKCSFFGYIAIQVFNSII